MKKIFSSFLLIALIIASVSLSAYALFSSTVDVGGLTFSTGNADLKISTDGTTWSNSVTLPSLYENMAPNFSSEPQNIYLKNESISSINLNIFSQIFDPSPVENEGTWAVIGDKIIVSFQKLVNSSWVDLASGTLQDWKNSGFALDTLAINTSQNYRMQVSLDGVDNEDSGQVLSGLSFNFIGTQE